MNYPHGMQVSPAYDQGCGYGYAAPVADYGHGSTFVLIVVLFILLIIVGAAWL